MLKHMKLKVAIEKPNGTDADVSYLGTTKTKTVVDDPSPKRIETTPEARPLESPLSSVRDEDERISEDVGNGLGIHRSNVHSDIHKWPSPDAVHLSGPPHEVVYNYKTTCTDPGCHCSPGKIYPNSPNFEELCSCPSCQQIPRMIHHGHVPYYHPSAMHIPESVVHYQRPTAGVFLPPEGRISHHPHHHPIYHSPTISHHAGSDWAKYAVPGFSHNTHNLLHPSSHQFWKANAPTMYGPSTSTAPQSPLKLSLPLSRASIISLVKDGKCDIILDSLDGPLHDESSPLYPLALKTVLEILDVIEKDFTQAYQTDEQVEADIHQLSNFVKNMGRVTLGESRIEYAEQRRTPVISVTPPVPTNFQSSGDRSRAVSRGERTMHQTGNASTVAEIAEAHADNRTEKMKLLLQKPIPDSIVIGDDIADILAKFKAKGSLPPTTDNQGAQPVEGINVNPQIDENESGVTLPVTADPAVPDQMDSALNSDLTTGEQTENAGHDNSGAFVPKEGSVQEEIQPVIEPIPSTDDIGLGNSDTNASVENEVQEENKSPVDQVSSIGDASLLNSNTAAKEYVDAENKSPVAETIPSTGDAGRLNSDTTAAKRGVDAGNMSSLETIPATEEAGLLNSNTTAAKEVAQAENMSPIESIPSTEVDTGVVHSDKAALVKCGVGEEFNRPINSISETQDGLVRPDAKAANEVTKQVETHAPSDPAPDNTDELLEDPSNMDAVDELLDRKLHEAREKSNSPLPNASDEPSSGYRGKGFKVRSIGGRDKPQTKLKVAVKTFAQIMNDQKTPAKPPVPDTQVGEVDKKMTDVNDNSPNVPSLNDGLAEKTTKEVVSDLPRCPSNPLSPSPSESLDATDFKSMLLKKKAAVAMSGHVVDHSTITLKLDNATEPGVTASSQLAKKVVPAPETELGKETVEKENTRESSPPSTQGKPLMTKTFHGKLLLQKNSKEGPHAIPVDVLDPALVPRDPRLALSNLMEPRVNHDLDTVHWKINASGNIQKTCLKGTNTSSLAPLNVRDPRVRRRLSGETVGPNMQSTSGVPKSTAVKSAGNPSQRIANVKTDAARAVNSVPGIVHPTTVHPTVGSTKEDATHTKKVVTSAAGSKHIHHLKSVIRCDAPMNPGSEFTPHGVKSVIVDDCVRTAGAAKPKVASVRAPLDETVAKMDTKYSFQESLSVLKGIKSDIKQALVASGGEVQKLDKQTVKSLSQRVSILEKAVEVSLLTTEMQKEKATGRRMDMLVGIFEDHFILTADLIIMRLWLNGSSPPSGSQGLEEFRSGVFSRRNAPPLKQIQKWIRNRYEVDGFKDAVLIKLTNLIVAEEVGEVRPRSRSSSTGSDKHKRKRSEGSRSSERHRSTSIEGEHQKQKTDDHKGKVPKRHNSAVSDKAPSTKDVPKARHDSDCVFPEGNNENPPVREGTSKRKSTGEDEELDVKKCKQSVTVSNTIQDFPQEMLDIKREVLIALSDRNTKIANRCLEKLPEMTRRAHAQLDNENKTLTSMKNVSLDTRAKFNDVVKGIQRMIVECEIMIYSLSWNANKAVGRKAKDTIWTMAQKSSHKPSYEEEVALLLSLRKSYTSTDMWFYIKEDVDERIASLQKKCRSSQQITALIEEYPLDDRGPKRPRGPPSAPYHVQGGGGAKHPPPMPSSIPVRQGFGRVPDINYNGPSNSNYGYPDNYEVPMLRVDFADGPVRQQFRPDDPASRQRQAYPPQHPPGGHREFQPRPPPPPPPPQVREQPRDFEYWRNERRPDDWDKPSGGGMNYNNSNRYTPPMMM